MAYTHLRSEKNPNQIIQVESEDKAEVGLDDLHTKLELPCMVKHSVLLQPKVKDSWSIKQSILKAFKLFEVDNSPLPIPELHGRVVEARLSTEGISRFVISKAAGNLVAHKIPLPFLTSIVPVTNKVTEKEFDPQAAYERMLAVKQRHRQRPIVPTSELKIIKHFPMPD